MSTLYKLDTNGTGMFNMQIVEHWLHEPSNHISFDESGQNHRETRCTLALFVFEEPSTAVGQYVERLVEAMAKWRTAVHVYVRERGNLDMSGVYVHQVGDSAAGSLMQRIEDYTCRAVNTFLREFQDTSHVTAMGFEWSAVPSISLLHGIKNIGTILSLHSLERQRGNMGEELSRQIEEIEFIGLREAKLIVAHDPATADTIRLCSPECAERIMVTNPLINVRDFQFDLDPAEIKARYQVGPVDPMILYIGDLHDNYGPDILMKAMPAVLKSHPQARCVFIGDGEWMWPLRVYSRYLLLDHAVRLVGSLEGRELYESVYASDLIVVPSRVSTPWWPIEAAWAANHPVVATYEAAPALVRRDQDAVLTFADEKSFADGIDRVLSDYKFGQLLAEEGHEKLENHYGVNRVVARIEALTGVSEASETPPGHVESQMEYSA